MYPLTFGSPFEGGRECKRDNPQATDWSYNDCEVMQFTGLNDRHGKEIYENDVVRIFYTDWPSQNPNEDGKYALSLDEYKDSISHVGKVEWNAELRTNEVA